MLNRIECLLVYLTFKKMPSMFSNSFCTLSNFSGRLQLVANNIFHKCAHVVLVCFVYDKSTTFIGLLDNEPNEECKKLNGVTRRGFVRAVNSFIATNTIDMICAVLDVWVTPGFHHSVAVLPLRKFRSAVRITLHT